MKNSRPYLFFTLLLYSACLSGQPDGLKLFSTGGGMSLQGSTYLSYSVGEPCIHETFSSGRWITEGFQQPDAVDLTTSIGKAEGQYALVIHPNPVSSSLFIKGNSLPECDVRVIDILGHVVLTNSIHPGEIHEVQMTSLSPGLYYLHIIHQQSSIASTPFIKI